MEGGGAAPRLRILYTYMYEYIELLSYFARHPANLETGFPAFFYVIKVQVSILAFYMKESGQTSTNIYKNKTYVSLARCRVHWQEPGSLARAGFIGKGRVHWQVPGSLARAGFIGKNL